MKKYVLDEEWKILFKNTLHFSWQSINLPALHYRSKQFFFTSPKTKEYLGVINVLFSSKRRINCELRFDTNIK